jgi:hypothetical protein
MEKPVERYKWIKSRHCDTGACVEVLVTSNRVYVKDPNTEVDMERNMWIKPSDKFCETGDCVEVFAADDTVGMVYVKPQSFTQDEWRAFIAAVKLGEFDLDD